MHDYPPKNGYPLGRLRRAITAQPKRFFTKVGMDRKVRTGERSAVAKRTLSLTRAILPFMGILHVEP